ncbi:MAG: pyroglutamyl-peptidase I [Defluviitaleaceae bacterium]|nr:pyroglutamyl-peptidase I [Defluviitaleaceae bacterium]
MKKVLITGFEPFGGEAINPSLEAVKLLPDDIEGVRLVKLPLPVVFGKSADILLATLGLGEFDAVICVGQAGGRTSINLERVAVNVDDTKAPDNEGNQPIDKVICEGAPDGYFATLPVKSIVEELKRAEIPAVVSDTAGTYVCNHVMFTALHYAAKHRPEMKAGFVHIPYLPAQVLDKGNAPSMSLENIVKALTIIIKTATS